MADTSTLSLSLLFLFSLVLKKSREGERSSVCFQNWILNQFWIDTVEDEHGIAAGSHQAAHCSDGARSELCLFYLYLIWEFIVCLKFLRVLWFLILQWMTISRPPSRFGSAPFWFPFGFPLDKFRFFFFLNSQSWWNLFFFFEYLLFLNLICLIFFFVVVLGLGLCFVYACWDPCFSEIGDFHPKNGQCGNWFF